jgi:hypothetical protein
MIRMAAIIVVAADVALAALASGSSDARTASSDNNVASHWVPFKVSKATTYITEPLQKDGYPDYAAALNRRLSNGVTPQNNASVLIWQAVGPASIEKERRGKFFELLGIPPLPEKGEYFVGIEKIEDPQDPIVEATGRPDFNKRWRSLDLAMIRPWTEREFPVLARWLAANKKPLRLLFEASQRTHRYDPIVVGKRGTAESTLLWSLHSKPFISHLSARSTLPEEALLAHAMLLVSRGEIDGAWENILACHRLARLWGQGPTLIDAIHADGIERRACTADQGLLRHVHLKASRLKEMREDLAKLPPMPEMADKIDLGERFMILDAFAMTSRYGLSFMDRIYGRTTPSDTFDVITDALADCIVDWDCVLRLGNAQCDRAIEAYRKPTHRDRKEAVARMGAESEELAKNLGTKVLFGLFNPRVEFSRWFGEMYAGVLLPLHHCRNSQDDAAMRFELTKLAFALAQYRVETNMYPAKLSFLAPTYVPAIPKDVFSDAELHFRQGGGGYVLYSVGKNGRDDGARGFENEEGQRSDEYFMNDWDDLVVRMTDR